MTKIISVIALQIFLLCLVPTIALAEQTPVKFSVSHNNDSDGVSYLSYNMATEKKNKPWNFSYAATSISQRDSTARLTEQRFITRWQQRFNEENSVAAWLGFSYSDNWQFAPFGIQYQGVVNTIDQIVAQLCPRFRHNRGGVSKSHPERSVCLALPQGTRPAVGAGYYSKICHV